MADPLSARTTRRTALKGLGIGGATALGLGERTRPVRAELLRGPVGTDDELLGRRRVDAVDVGAALGTTPGLTYATSGMFAFQPNLFANGYSVSGTGCFSSTSAGFVVAALTLPTGAVVKQVTFTGQNSSGAPASFFVEQYPLDAGGSTIVADVSMPTGAAVLQTVTANVNHVVDAGFSYDAATFTSTEIRMYSCRIGYAGPYGFLTVNPQERKLDTREPGPLTGKILGGQTRTLSLKPELPAGAVAAVLNVTVTETVGGGFLVLYPANAAQPPTASINWSEANQTIGNSSTVVVSPARAVKITCGATPGGRTHVVVDLIGYLR